MFRHLFYAAAFLSAFLLLATLVLWPVSHYEYLAVSYTRHSGTTYTFSIGSGRVFFTYQADYDPSLGGKFGFIKNSISGSDWSYRTWNFSWDKNLWFEGAGIFVDHFVGPLAVDELLIPFSYLAVLWATIPWLTWRWHRHQRRPAGAFEPLQNPTPHLTT